MMKGAGRAGGKDSGILDFGFSISEQPSSRGSRTGFDYTLPGFRLKRAGVERPVRQDLRSPIHAGATSYPSRDGSIQFVEGPALAAGPFLE
jgi:hypothetical protein